MNSQPSIKPDYLVLAGPTASGKTAASIALAQHWPIEIISMDSALVYRDLNIGTAKPSREEQLAVPHHLIDIIDPSKNYSAAEFAADASGLIQEIRQRGKLPVIVGGTFLYLKALTDGLSDLPTANAAIRLSIETKAKALGWPALHAELALVDPATAARLAPRDSQRIGRALEVWQSTGRSLTEHFQQQRSTTNDLSHLLISLEPTDRKFLHHRINQRFELMLQNGLVEEVRQLRARPDLNSSLPSMRCVGYRQTWEMLDECDFQQRQPNPADLARLLERGSAATRQLAKRQLTWLRSLADRQILACDDTELISNLIEFLKPRLIQWS
jgi:tRNA dimethylallyltransferase